jgi:hypothetical protein
MKEDFMDALFSYSLDEKVLDIEFWNDVWKNISQVEASIDTIFIYEFLLCWRIFVVKEFNDASILNICFKLLD